MRLLLEEGQFDDAQLLVRQPPHRLAHALFQLDRCDLRFWRQLPIDTRLNGRFLVDVELATVAPFAPERVDPQIARDGEYPGRAGTAGKKRVGFAPDILRLIEVSVENP